MWRGVFNFSAPVDCDHVDVLADSFAWSYMQYVLTPEGIDYLREFLHLPAEVRTYDCIWTRQYHRLIRYRTRQIVPATFKKQVRAPRPGVSRPEGAYRAPRRDDGEGYRRKEAGDDFRPRFSYVERSDRTILDADLNRLQWCRSWWSPPR